MNSFINKLISEEKFKLVEPSEEICKAYITKSEKSLISSKTLLKINNLDDATALIYYSMYYSALALMFKAGIKCENHSGTIILLKEVFNINTQNILNAKKERIDKQYYIDSESTLFDVKKGIDLAEEFNSIIKEKIETIKESEIKDNLKKLKEIYF